MAALPPKGRENRRPITNGLSQHWLSDLSPPPRTPCVRQVPSRQRSTSRILLHPRILPIAASWNNGLPPPLSLLLAFSCSRGLWGFRPRYKPDGQPPHRVRLDANRPRQLVVRNDEPERCLSSVALPRYPEAYGSIRGVRPVHDTGTSGDHRRITHACFPERLDSVPCWGCDTAHAHLVPLLLLVPKISRIVPSREMVALPSYTEVTTDWPVRPIGRSRGSWNFRHELRAHGSK